MTTKTITIEIDAAKYEDHDDCLAAAVRDVQKARGLKGWALRARWADDNRETILIDVPAEAGEGGPSKMTTTYTVLNNNGDVIDSGLNAVEAMDVILTDDGHEWEIRPEADGEGFRLWTTTHSRNSTGYEGLTASTVYSLNADEEAAMQEIAAKVIAVRWPRKPEAMTDAAYAAMLSEAGE